MAEQPSLVLHSLPFSHPVLAVSVALDRNGLDYETVQLQAGPHAEEIERIYGSGKRTVPGLLVDGEPVHGTTAIFARLAELAPDAELYPEATADAIRAAERGVAEQIQSTARVLAWGALHFRPEALGTFGGAGPLDPAGTDFAIKMLRSVWRYLEISATQVAEKLDLLPGQLQEVDELIEAGILGGAEPTAADYQIGSTLQLLLTLGDVAPLIENRPAAGLVSAWFEASPGAVPAGAFPQGWAPEPAGAATA